MHYGDYLRYSPFIISQIGKSQNEFVLSPEFLLQRADEFSKLLYTQLEATGTRDSFLRVVEFGHHVAVIYYWATDAREVHSQRGGLFVISGLLVDRRSFFHNWHTAAFHCRQFFKTLGQVADVNLEEATCDPLFAAFQGGHRSLSDHIMRYFRGLLLASSEDGGRQDRWFARLRARMRVGELYGSGYLPRITAKGRAAHQRCLIVTVDRPFDAALLAIMAESIHGVGRLTRCLDVSTKAGIAPVYVEVIKWGGPLPDSVRELHVVQYADVRYLRSVS